jgi:autotransporter translocation and assembly factor TamB
MLSRTKTRRNFFIAFIALLIFLATVISIYFLLQQQIQEFLTQKSTELISKSINAEITAEGIEGNILRGVELSGVEIVLPAGDSLHAEKIKVEYDLWSIIRRRSNRIHQLKITKPSIHLVAKPGQPRGNAKLNLNLTFPLLFINRLEILDGRLLSNGTIVIDTFSLLANLQLRTKRAWLHIVKLSCYLPNFRTAVQDIRGSIELHNNIMSMVNFEIRSTLLTTDFDAKINLDKRVANIKTKNSNLNLKTLNENNDGQIIFNGVLSVSFPMTDWIVSNITSELNYESKNLLIQHNSIPDGKGILVIKDSILTADFRALVNDSAGSTELSLVSDIYFSPLSYQGQLKFANLPVRLQENQLSLNGHADFKGVKTDSVDVAIFTSSKNPQVESISAQAKLRKGKIILEQLRIKDKTNILDAYGQGQIISGRREFSLHFMLSDFSLSFLADLLNVFMKSDIDLAGVVNGSVSVESRGKSIASSANATVKNGSYDNLQFDQLDLGYQLDDITRLNGAINLSGDSILWAGNYFSHIGYIQRDSNFSLQINNWQNNSIMAAGRLQTNYTNINCLIDTLQIIGITDTFRNKQVFSFGKTDSQLYLKDMSLMLGSGTLSVDLVKDQNRRPKINLAANQINLDDISEFISLKQTIKGLIDLDITATENSTALDINLAGYDIEIPMTLLNNHPNNHQAPIMLKLLQGDFTLHDSMFLINELNLIHKVDTSKIYGSVLLDQKPVAQLPLDINITFADPGAWLFFFLKQTIDLREGKIYGQGRVQGSLQAPDLSGEVLVTDGNLYIVPTKTPCQDVTAQLVFNKLNINIEALQGKVGPGDISAQGFVKLLEFTKVDTLSIGITFKDAPFRPSPDIFAIASGRINIDLREDNNIREKTPLSLAGDIQIKEALLTTEFESGASVSTGDVEEIDFNLKISGERDIWLRNRMCDVELSADLNIFSQEKNNVYSGELTAIQGNFYYLDHSLRLTKGVLTFDNISEFDPELDISAELATRQIEVQPGQFERVKIILALTDRLSQPSFAFSSDPAYLTENDIISYLTFNVTWQEMSASESREIFTNALSGKLLGYFERELTKRIRNFIYLDYLWIESGIASGNGAKVTVGKYISPKLYFTYEYDITGNVYDIFRLEYYLTKSHEAIGEHDKDGRYKLKYQYKIRY